MPAEKSVCLGGYNRTTGKRGWYVLPSISIPESGDPPRPVYKHHHHRLTEDDLVFCGPIGETKNIIDACWAVLGSTIYSMGGRIFGVRNFEPDFVQEWFGAVEEDEPTRIIRCFNFGTTAPGAPRWESAPSMIAGRSHAHAVVLDGKIYVLGGHDDPWPWGEVFDPSKHQWEALPDPPFWYDSQFVAIVHEDQKRILVGLSEFRFLFSYDVATRRWEEPYTFTNYSDDRLYGSCDSQPCSPVSVGDKLYWLDIDQLCVLDVSTQLYSSGIVDRRFSFEILHSSSLPVLIHLSGNIFCIIWPDDGHRSRSRSPTDSDSEDRDTTSVRTRFHCLKFQVMGTEKNSLVTSRVSCQSCVINDAFCFDGAMVL